MSNPVANELTAEDQAVWRNIFYGCGVLAAVTVGIILFANYLVA